MSTGYRVLDLCHRLNTLYEVCTDRVNISERQLRHFGLLLLRSRVIMQRATLSYRACHIRMPESCKDIRCAGVEGEAVRTKLDRVREAATISLHTSRRLMKCLSVALSTVSAGQKLKQGGVSRETGTICVVRKK